MSPKNEGSSAESFAAPRSNVFSQIAVGLLALISIAILVFGLGASMFWIMLGSIAWIAGLLLKLCLAGLTYLYVPLKGSKMNAGLSGIQSSVSELGTAALCFHLYQPQTLVLENILAFGTGAGATEIVFLLGSMSFEKPPAENIDRWLKGARVSFCVRHGFFLERAITLMGHIGSRGLISLSVLSERYEFAAIALLSFAITDGLAAYGNLKAWDWFNPFTCSTFYAICASISVIEVALFTFFAMRLL